MLICFMLSGVVLDPPCRGRFFGGGGSPIPIFRPTDGDFVFPCRLSDDGHGVLQCGLFPCRGPGCALGVLCHSISFLTIKKARAGVSKVLMLTIRALLLARPSEPMALVFVMCGHKNSCTSAAVLYRISFFDAAKVQTFCKPANFFLN